MKRPETALHLVVAQYLDYALPSSAIWTTVDAGGVKLSAEQAKLRERLGMKAGWPDIQVLYGGVLHGIELKAGRNGLSPAQCGMQAAIEAAGGHYHVCRSVAEVEAALRPYVPLSATTGQSFAPRAA